MQLPWFQLAAPPYTFEYNPDRSDQMVTVTNMFHSDSIQNHVTECKLSIRIPGIINRTRKRTELKCIKSIEVSSNLARIIKCKA